MIEIKTPDKRVKSLGLMLASMPPRDRQILGVFGFLVAVFVAFAFFQVNGYDRDQRQQRQDVWQRIVDRPNIDEECSDAGSLSDRIFCALEQSSVLQERSLANANLNTQQDMAKWALVLVFVSVIGIIVSAGGITLIYATLIETRRMTRATQDVGEGQIKAFVNAERIEIRRITYEDTHAHIQADVYLVNHGHSPALDVQVELTFSVFRKVWSEQGADQERRQSFSETTTPRDVVALIPNTTPQEVSFVLPLTIEQKIQSGIINALDLEQVGVNGAIYYNCIFGRKHVTEFIFEGYFSIDKTMPKLVRTPDRVRAYERMD